MKRMKQIIAWTAVTVLLLAAMPTANAEEQPTVNGGTFTFVKELEMNKETDIPAAEMKFTIAAGSAAAYSEGKLAVQAGPVKKSGFFGCICMTVHCAVRSEHSPLSSMC